MTYFSAKKWLYSLHFAMKGFSLTVMEKLSAEANLDTKKIKVIHVAGSNGKGSTAGYVSQVLIEAGYRTGLYTSPHLVEHTERIRVNGEKISRKKFAELAEHFRTLTKKKKINANYFEIITAMAIKHFIDEKADFIVAETGMGGRLDATNILDGEVCAITSISLEHTQYLGKTTAKIAEEKAGIIKKGSIVVTKKNNAGINAIRLKVKKLGNRIIYPEWKNAKQKGNGQTFDLVKPVKIKGIELSMLGKFQAENAAIAIGVIKSLEEKGISIPENILMKGIAKTVVNGRLEKIISAPLVVLDAGHSPDGWEKTFASLGQFKYKKLIVVIGTMHDKNVKPLKKLLKKANYVITTKSDSFRALESEKLSKAIGFGEAIEPAEKAFEKAAGMAKKGDLILITGSIYLIGKAYPYFKIKI